MRESLLSGNWDNKDKGIQPFLKCAKELTLNKSENIILKGTGIVISKSLQETAMKLAHVGHQGIEKTKSLLLEKGWCPSIDATVRKIVEKCVPCQALRRSKIIARTYGNYAHYRHTMVKFSHRLLRTNS